MSAVLPFPAGRALQALNDAERASDGPIDPARLATILSGSHLRLTLARAVAEANFWRSRGNLCTHPSDKANVSKQVEEWSLQVELFTALVESEEAYGRAAE